MQRLSKQISTNDCRRKNHYLFITGHRPPVPPPKRRLTGCPRRGRRVIGILDQALYTVCLNSRTLKNSHDKWFDRAMYTNKLSNYIEACTLEQSTDLHSLEEFEMLCTLTTNHSTMSGGGCLLRTWKHALVTLVRQDIGDHLKIKSALEHM